MPLIFIGQKRYLWGVTGGGTSQAEKKSAKFHFEGPLGSCFCMVRPCVLDLWLNGFYTGKKVIFFQLKESPILPYSLLLLCHKMVRKRYSTGVKGIKNAFLRPLTMAWVSKNQILFGQESLIFKAKNNGHQNFTQNLGIPEPPHP